MRFPFVLLGVSMEIAGWAIQVVYVPSAGVRYFSLFLLSGGTFLQMAMLSSWMTNNLRGRASNAVGTAIILGMGNTANFVATNVFFKSEAPRYPTAFKTGLGISCMGFTVCLVYVGILWLHNTRLEKKRKEKGDEAIDNQTEYRYVY